MARERYPTRRPLQLYQASHVWLLSSSSQLLLASAPFPHVFLHPPDSTTSSGSSRPISDGILLYFFIVFFQGKNQYGTTLVPTSFLLLWCLSSLMVRLLFCTMHQPFILFDHDMTTGAAGCNPHSCCLGLEMPATPVVGLSQSHLALQTGRISVRICRQGIGTTAAASDTTPDTTPDITADRPS